MQLALLRIANRLASFFTSAGIVAGGEHLACLRTPLAGISQADFRIHTQCQQFFLACKEVFQPPVFAAGRHD